MGKKNKILNKVANDKYICEMQYKNLREHFKKMTDAILGEDYYNMSMDVYTCDELTCEDIVKEYEKVMKERDNYRVIAVMSAILFPVLLVIMSIVLLVWR